MIKAENRYKNTNILGVTMFKGKIFIQHPGLQRKILRLFNLRRVSTKGDISLRKPRAIFLFFWYVTVIMPDLRIFCKSFLRQKAWFLQAKYLLYTLLFKSRFLIQRSCANHLDFRSSYLLQSQNSERCNVTKTFEKKLQNLLELGQNYFRNETSCAIGTNFTI